MEACLKSNKLTLSNSDDLIINAINLKLSVQSQLMAMLMMINSSSLFFALINHIMRYRRDCYGRFVLNQMHTGMFTSLLITDSLCMSILLCSVSCFPYNNILEMNSYSNVSEIAFSTRTSQS